MTKKIEYAKLRVDFKKRWIKALNSGEYEQTRAQLADKYDGENSYCCMGVACELTKEKYNPREGYPDEWNLEKMFHKVYLEDYQGSALVGCPAQGILSRTLLKLGNLNDDKRWKFPAIAKWIEKNL